MRKFIEKTELKNGETALYLDKYGILHATNSPENLAAAAVGKCLVTDECTVRGGYPAIDGEKVRVFGAGKGYVYLSSRKRDLDIRYFTGEETYKAEGSVTVDRTKLKRAAHKAYRIANGLYLELAK